MELNVLLIFLLGASIGSFINVLIYRIPLKESIVFGRSRCPKCQYQLSWFDNIPIISWLLLLGKCRKCKENISINYPIVELVTAFLYVLNLNAKPTLYIDSQFLFSKILGFILIFICISLFLFDLKFFWLPSFITLCGLSIGLGGSLLVSVYENFNINYLIYSASAAFFGYLFFLLLRVFGEKIFRKPVLGRGDEKLVALLGSFLGLKGLVITIWLTFNSAGIFVLLGLLLKKLKRNQRIPLGIFLTTSGLTVWYFGNSFFSNLIFYPFF